MKAKSKFAIGAGIIVIAISCLAYVGAQQSKTYYHTISEIPTLDGPALHQRLRVGGDVKAGSIQHYSGRIDFVLVEQGKVQPDGRFVAETVQAKCASKYEAAPGQTQPANGAPAAYPDGKG